MLRISGLLNFAPQYHIVLLYMYQILSNHARYLLVFAIIHTKSVSKSVMQITPTSSNAVLISCRFLLASSFSNASRYFLLFVKMFPTCDMPILYHSANCRWLSPLLSLSLITSSFAYRLSLFLTHLFAVAFISFWLVMPLIL